MTLHFGHSEDYIAVLDKQKMPSPDHDFEPDSNVTRASLFGQLGAKAGPEREVAWDKFQARYAPLIAGFAARCGASRQDIDDIIQDVMTGMLRAADGFEYDPAKGRFRSFLKTCTVRSSG